MFLHASSQALVTIRRQDRDIGPVHLVEFVDPATAEVLAALPARSGSELVGVDDLFVVLGWNPAMATLEVGRVEARSIECSVEVTPTGSSVVGEGELLDALPPRLDIGGGYLVERHGDGFVLRTFDLDRHLGEPPPNEMPALWRLTPDGRHAIVWRMKGSREWPVIDLDTDEIVHRIDAQNYHEPDLAFGPGDAIQVGVSDQLHRLDSIWGQLSTGVRLKNDMSGSYIDGMRVDDDGSLLITWVGRGELPEMAGVETVEQLVQTVNRDQVAFVRSLVDSRRYGVVLRFDLGTNTATSAAEFSEWVLDPIVQGADVIALSWSARTVVRSRLEPVVWPTYPPRALGETLWF